MPDTRGRLASAASQLPQNVTDEAVNQNTTTGNRNQAENIESEESGTEEVVEGAEGEVEDDGSWTIAGKSKKAKYICKGGMKECGLVLTLKDESIRCDVCKLWYHPRCQGLSIEAFRAHGKYDFMWLCLECKPRFNDVVDAGKRILSRIDDAEKKILTVLTENKQQGDVGKRLEGKIMAMEKMVSEQIKDQQAKVEALLKAQKEAAQAMPKYSEELKKSANEFKKLVETKEDKERRERNVLIHNIPECESANAEERQNYDHLSFQNIVTALLGEEELTNMEAVGVIRLGKKVEGSTGDNVKPRLMLVKLKEKEKVDKLIKQRTRLRDVGFSNVYLTRDLAPDERQEQKKLREELHRKGKNEYTIFRGQVVRREAVRT